jgi:hypothetical protein
MLTLCVWRFISVNVVALVEMTLNEFEDAQASFLQGNPACPVKLKRRLTVGLVAIDPGARTARV